MFNDRLTRGVDSSHYPSEGYPLSHLSVEGTIGFHHKAGEANV
jgi:hypothetical protein